MLSRWLQTFRLGLKSLLLHKLRSGLAVLGILIGVTAVIWLVAMGEGVSHQAQEQIKELGAKNIIIRSVKPPMDSSRTAASLFVDYGLMREDYERIVHNIPTVRQAVPLRELHKEARYQSAVADIRLVGCTPEYVGMNNLRLAHGRFLTDRDLARRENVCILGYAVARQLFPYEDPIGKNIQIDKDFYVIIGQTQERTATGGIGGSFSGQDFNLDIYIPLTTLRSRIGDQVMTSRGGSREGEIVQLSQITVTVGEIDEVDDTADMIRSLLEKFHRDPDYAVIVPKELLRQAEVTRIMFNVLLVLIAGIALVVGGIGIMNIMLATVTERTREIGIRRALGAKQRDIVEQFLTETIVLSATGGMLGVLFGFACRPVVSQTKWLLQQFLPDVMTSLPPNISQLEPRIAPWSIIAAFLISVGVGVVFGLYPARRAAQMDPIEALRHE
ncbi:MAG TPA: ABC transporter permease [Pirellulales bacterium]|jgi:putative ABC transport system permease protein|nr:ABC transporter permease [Pirellulales bacterium]